MKKHWLAFNHEWFARHQGKLLWLLAVWPFSRIMRKALCIRESDIGYHGRIVAIFPHAYIITRGLTKDGRELLTADIRTHWKYSKRVYFAFRPLWWAMHCWDWLLADRFLPEFSFGFATLTKYPDPDPESTTVDGQVFHAVPSTTWANVRDGAGNGVSDAGTSGYCEKIVATTTTDQYTELVRGIFLFDTSAIGADATVSSAIMAVYVLIKGNSFGGTDMTHGIFGATPASNTALAASDYAQTGTTALSDLTNYASLPGSGYASSTLNASGISSISKTGVSKFATREGTYDAPNVAPTWSSAASSNILISFADETGTNQDPKLEVTYVVAMLNNRVFNKLRPSAFRPGLAR